MNRFRKTIITLLREHGAELVRQRKHKVYRFPGGKIYVESGTPSDQLGERRTLADLKRTLELPVEKRPTNGNGARHKPKPGRVEPVHYEKIESVSATFADKLRLSGAVELTLRDELTMNQEHIEILTARITELEAWVCPSWWCRLRRAVKRD